MYLIYLIPLVMLLCFCTVMYGLAVSGTILSETAERWMLRGSMAFIGFSGGCTFALWVGAS